MVFVHSPKDTATTAQKLPSGYIIQIYSNEHDACTCRGRNFFLQSLLRPLGSAPKKDPTRLGARLTTVQLPPSHHLASRLGPFSFRFQCLDRGDKIELLVDKTDNLRS
ncbi:unnamed protein product [Prunus armeniaca]